MKYGIGLWSSTVWMATQAWALSTVVSAQDAHASASSVRTGDAIHFVVNPGSAACTSEVCPATVRAMNLSATPCGNGTSAASCAISGFDLGALGLSPDLQRNLLAAKEHAVFVGRLVSGINPQARPILVAEEAWRGVSKTPAGAALLTKQTDIVCITQPCPTHIGTAVNRDTRIELTRVDLSALQISQAERTRLDRALAGEGAILAGRLATSPSQSALDVTQAYLRIGPRMCGSRGLPECGGDSFCSFEPGSCGELDHPGVCKPRPSICNRIFQPVCGCDGRSYGNSCEAEVAGVSIDHQGPCEARDVCEPQAARGIGQCEIFFGFAWDGAACVPLGGCSCDGPDCARLSETEEECEAVHAACVDAGPVTCGGITGRSCPGLGSCVEASTCSTLSGEGCPVCSDCEGICECSGANVLCAPGKVFDASPSVCACTDALAS